MKKISLIVIFLFGFQTAFSNVGFGLRGGLNFAQLSQRTHTLGEYQIETLPDSDTGWHLGGVMQIRFLGAFVQPELLFVTGGNHLRLLQTGQDDYFFRQRFSRMDLPVMIGLSMGPLRLGAGPVASYILGNSSELSEHPRFNNVSVRERFNDATFGFQAGVGLNLGNILLDFKYESSVSRYGNGIEIGGVNYNFDTRPSQYILSIGLLF
jgi:hypothetical protein